MVYASTATLAAVNAVTFTVPTAVALSVAVAVDAVNVTVEPAEQAVLPRLQA
jgi:hypothetical protein